MTSEQWWVRLKRDREARGKSQMQAARELVAHADHYDPAIDDDTVLKAWQRWERGQLKGLPSLANQDAIARMFGTPRATYFAPVSNAALPERLSGGEAVELMGRLRSSNVDDTALDLVRLQLDQLSTDYASQPGPVVLADAQAWLAQVANLKNGGPSLRQHTEIYNLAGQLCLLVACLMFDQGDARAAEAARRSAMSLGVEAGNSEILGWAGEIKAWMALTRGEMPAVIAAVKEGLAATSTHSVSVQLYAQEAKAWARLGNRTRFEVALDAGRRTMDTLPYPDNPRNHFQVDPAKFDFYVMDCYRAAGEDQLALATAETVIRASTDPAGVAYAPMRVAEAELTHAIVYARAGELETAISWADRALDRGRRSLPSLTMVGSEVAREMRRLHPSSTQAAEFSRHVAELRTTA